MKNLGACLLIGTAGLIAACSIDPRSDGPESEVDPDKNQGGSAGDSSMSDGGAGGSDDEFQIIDIPQGGDNNQCDEALGPCEEEAVCGDGVLQDSAEECDDANTDAGDGCSDLCLLEPGYVCPINGAACRAAACGDGILAGLELCDDGNTVAGDGCTETCAFESGYDCQTPGQACVKTDCGNGEVEGTEACDDGNNYLGDGCSTFCEKEPSCAPPNPCSTECGDGIKFGDEECDDANTRDGDGCSATCEIEDGFVCDEVASDSIDIPIVYRDFKAYEDGGHVAFQWSGSDPINRTLPEDIWVRTTLGTAADTTTDGTSLLGRPIFKWYAECDAAGCADITPPQGIQQPAGTAAASTCDSIEGSGTGTRLITVDGRNVHFCGYGAQDFNTFSQWYLDGEGVNQTINSTLTLNKGVDGAYAYDNNAFFPIDGMGFGNYSTKGHNYHFTSEVRYWFRYDAAADATLTFDGDDDVWVFVNGKLVVDISGTHREIMDSVTVNPSVADIDGNALNLTDGRVYEIVVFQAERNTNDSNYRLTLQDFNLAPSICESVCGDGIVTRDEACDDGVNDGSYGTCKADCSRAPFCGDGTLQMPQEACDDGNRKNGDGCSANCFKEAIK